MRSVFFHHVETDHSYFSLFSESPKGGGHILTPSNQMENSDSKATKFTEAHKKGFNLLLHHPNASLDAFQELMSFMDDLGCNNDLSHQNKVFALMGISQMNPNHQKQDQNNNDDAVDDEDNKSNKG